jgi:hypothetical protein
MKIRFLLSLLFTTFCAYTQTPSTYPYFNRIHIASDSTHPSFYHFYAGGQRISEDTILLLGHQYSLINNQDFQRTLEFIDVNTGDLIKKHVEPSIIALQNPPFSSTIRGTHFYNLGILPNGVRTLRKYLNIYQNTMTDYPIDAYPSNNTPDFYNGFSILNDGNFLFYGSSPFNKALLSVCDTTGVIVNSTNLEQLNLFSNPKEVFLAKQLFDNSILIELGSVGINYFSGKVILLNENYTLKKQLLSLNKSISSNFIQHSDSSIYLFGFQDTTNSSNNAHFISYIRKYDQEGDLIWKKYYPIEQIQLQDQTRPLASKFFCAQEYKSGNILFIGNDIFKGADGDYQQMDGEQSLQTRLLCITPDGDIIWERSFHTSAENSSLALGFIPLVNDDVLIYGGIMEDFFFYQKAFVAKVNCIGRMTDLMHDVHANEQDGLVSIQIEADSFYETTIDWGDGSTSTNFQTAYSDSSELFFAQHLYAQSESYQITVSTRGCKDTLVYELVQEAHVPDNNDAELSMFPNPTLGFFKIKIPTNEVLNLEVTDAFGKLVYQFKDVSLFNGFDVDLTMQPVGQYHIRITGKARSWVGKVVKI